VLNGLQDKQQVVLSSGVNVDLVGIYREETISCACVFVVREGITVRSAEFVLNKGNDVSEQFSVVSNEATFTITPRSVMLRSKDKSREYDGTPLTGSGEFTVEGDGFADGDGVVVTPTASRTLVGVTENTFDWGFNEGTKAENYDVTVEYGLLSITNRDARYEITMTAKSDTVEYDEKEHSVSGFEESVFDIEGNKYSVEGVEAEAKGIEEGVYSTVISGTATVKDGAGDDVSDQFAVSYKSGSLTITDTSGSGFSASPVQGRLPERPLPPAVPRPDHLGTVRC
jgi:hypothetical protein